MWFAIIGALLAAFAAGLLYISFRAAHFGIARRAAGGRKARARLLCLAVFAALTAVLWRTWNMMNALVCMVHLTVFWLICDLTAAIIARLRRRKPRAQRAGVAALALCAVYLAGGWYAAHHVWAKNYTFETGKLDGDLRVVQITDAHVGATFDAEGFAAHLRTIGALSPDAVVVTGDFVDDGTSRADMLGACRALGALETKYGVFFAYGNHDKGYGRAQDRGWTSGELREALTENGVILLEDEARLIDGRFYLVGRKDRSEGLRGGGRQTAEQLLADLDRGKYIILLDHQPNDFDAEAAAGADLVLCGHTHGGQFIPIRHVGVWTGENDLRYGHEKRRDTDFIVCSGISCWTFRFKTGCHSEYAVIDIKGTSR